MSQTNNPRNPNDPSSHPKQDEPDRKDPQRAERPDEDKGTRSSEEAIPKDRSAEDGHSNK